MKEIAKNMGIGAVDYKESFLFQLNEYGLDAKETLKHFRNPPALAYMEDEQQILPDMFIEMKDNDVHPDLMVSQIDKYDNFAKQKFKEAKLILEAAHAKPVRTIAAARVCEQIVEVQVARVRAIDAT